MILSITTKEKHKINALNDIIKKYELFKDAEVVIKEGSSGVSEQPISLEEIINGANNRARLSFDKNTVFSFGIEQGLMEAQGTKTGFFDVCVCTIYDGKNYYSGISSGNEHPQKVLGKVFKDKITIGQAYSQLGLIDKSPFKYDKGTEGILSKGYFSRKDKVKQAIEMAVIQLQNKEYFCL